MNMWLNGHDLYIIRLIQMTTYRRNNEAESGLRLNRPRSSSFDRRSRELGARIYLQSKQKINQ